MTILLNFQTAFKRISKDPIQYRVECLNVAINTHIGLYEQEKDFDGMNVYVSIKNLVKNCVEWTEVEQVLNGLENFYNFFHIENNFDILRTEAILKISLYRGYFSNSELDNIVSNKNFLKIQNIFNISNN